MKAFLNNEKIYVKNEDNLIYQVKSVNMYDNTNYLTVDLELVAGYDYVNPDHSDKQGYVSAERFVESVQNESVVVYFLEESVKEVLEANYEILEKLPFVNN